MRRVLGYVLLGLVLSFALRSESFFLGRGIDPEEGVSLLQGRALCEGYLPYTKYFDHRPPLLYANFAAAQSIFGERVLSCRLWTAMCVGLGAAFLGLILRHLLRANLPAVVAMVVAVLLTTGVPGLTATPELMTMPWTVLAVLLALFASERSDRVGLLWTAAAGLSLGLATQNNLVSWLELPVVVAAMYVSADRQVRTARAGFGRCAVLCATAILPTLVAASVYALAGEFRTYLFSAFTFDLLSLATFTPRPSDLKQSLIDLRMYLPLLPLLAFALIALILRKLNRPLLLLTGVWLAGSLLGILANGRPLAHHLLTLVPALGLIVGLAVQSVMRRERVEGESVRPRFTPAAWMATTSLAALVVSVGIDHYRRYPALRSEHMESIRYSWLMYRYHYMNPGQILFLTNNDPIAYYTSKTEPATKYIFPTWLGRKEMREILGIDWNREIQSALAKGPVLIVVRPTSSSWEPKLTRNFETSLREQYRTQRKAKHVVIYMLRTVNPPPLPADVMP